MVAGFTYGGVLAVSSVSELSWLAKFALGFASATVGIMGRDLADMLTPMGVAPFEPLSPWYRGYGFCRGGNQNVNEPLLKMGAFTFSMAVVVGTVGIQPFSGPFTGILS
jgi:inner membrane protein